MDLPGRHRFLLDTHALDGVGDALLRGADYIRPSQSAYGVAASDLAFISVVRRRSVSFGYNVSFRQACVTEADSDGW
jgi:hypothetical protein